MSKWIQTIFAPHTEINWNQQSNKTLFFWSYIIMRKMKVYDLTHICFSCRTTCGTKLRFGLVLAKTPNYLLWEIYAYRMMRMGLRHQYIFGNWYVKSFFWSFDAQTQIFGNKTQNTCTSQFQSNLIKPQPQKPEKKGCSFAVFSQKWLMILRCFFDRLLAHDHC